MSQKLSWWEERKRRAKQVAAGLIESTVANSAEKGYRPAAIDTVGAIPAIVGALVNRRQDGKAFSGDTRVERVLNESLAGVQRASRRTNRALGITDPTGTRDTLLRVAGGLILPAPKGATVARALTKAPGGKKVVEAGKKVAASTPKAVKLPAKAVAEVTMPLRQTSTPAAAAIGLGITTVVDTVLDKSVDPVTGQVYDGEIGKRVKRDLGITDPAPEEVVDPELDELEQLTYRIAVEVGDIDEEAEVEQMLSKEITPVDADNYEEEDKIANYTGAATAIGAVLGGAAFAKYGSRYVRARQAAASMPENVPAFTQKKVRTSKLGPVRKAKQKLVQQDEPIRDMAEAHLGRTYAKQWGYRADRMTNVSIGSRVKNFFHTGQLPGVPGRTQRLAPLAEAWSKELTDAEQRLVSDAMLAASALDDYRATGTLAALNRDRAGNVVTPAQLEALVQQVTSNPKYNKYFESVQKSYDDLLKYRVVRGRDTHEAYQRLRARRPNYVVMNRNLETDAPFQSETKRYSANDDQGLGAARSLEEGGGVQGTTGVGNPFISLFDEWTNEIRRSDLNELRGDFLVRMDASGALNNQGKKIIEQVTPNRTDDDIHRVRINGRELAFKVRDPEVARALHMSPRATVKTLEAIRQFTQSLTTGPFATTVNLFAASVSPIYDAGLAVLTRAPGVKLGVANRALIGGYVGAARYIKDSVVGGMATTLRDNMIREHSWLKGLVGDNNLDNMAKWFENVYDNSIKAEMDRIGITSHTMYGSADASQLVSGVEDVAPSFARAAEGALRNDIADAAVSGDMGPFKAALATSKSAFATARATRIANVYQNVIEALHNGVRYQAHAANRHSIRNLDEHISNMRRLSADASQHGGSDAVNRVAGSLMYANLGMQSIYEVGKRARENPVTFLMNMGSLTGTLAAMHYAALGSDPVAMEKHRLKTPQQRARSLTTFGGAEIPLDPVTRLFIAPAFAIYDHMSGVHTGEYNPNFFNVMESWLDGETPEMGEEAHKEVGVGLWEAIQANDPTGLVPMLAGEAPNAAVFPIAGVALASVGIDPGMTRMTGQATEERTQGLTGLESDTRRPDSVVSAHTENMITAIFSTTGRSVLQMADDLYRGYGKSGDLNKSIDLATQRWKDNAVKGSGPFRPLLFGQYESVESAADTNYQLFKERDAGIEQALKLYQTDVRTGGHTSTYTPRYSQHLPEEVGVLPPEVNGTEAGYIAEMANQLERQFLSKNRQILSGLGEQVEAYGAQYLTPIEGRNRDINKVNEERRYQRMMMLTTTREYEELISERLGRPFTFENFDPKEYLNPLAPTTQ